MTSPVDTSVKFITSQMVGAGALALNTSATSGAGTINAIMDALLVNGWDAVTPSSIVVAGGVATVTFAAAHSCLQDTVILVSGVSGGATNYLDLNGEQKVTLKPNTTTATFACPTVGNGTCTGTLGVKMAGCGWTKPFSATGKGVYKSGDPRSFGFYYRIDETAITTQARFRGYETMVDVDTGNGLFPTELQLPGGLYMLRGSQATLASPIDFVVIADSMTAYYWPRSAQYLPSYFYPAGITLGFGDLIPASPRDAYASFICGNPTPSTNHTNTIWEGLFTGHGSAFITFPRSYTGLGAAVQGVSYAYCGSIPMTSGTDTACYGPYPDLNAGKLRMSKRILVQNNWPSRGELPGIRSFPHSLMFDSFLSFSIVLGDEADLGRRFLLMREMAHSTNWTSAQSSTSIGIGAFDLTGPWR